MLSHSLNRLRLFATPWSMILCPWDIPGKNIGVGCHFLLQEIVQFNNQTWVSGVSCIAGIFFTTEPLGKPVLLLLSFYLFQRLFFFFNSAVPGLSCSTQDLLSSIVAGGIFLVLLLFSLSVMSDSLRPYELQHARLPCPSLSPGVCSNSCPLGQ